ncbi:MAG: ABC transporter permease [Methanobacteriota archaeon]
MSELGRIYGFFEKQVNLYRKFWVWEFTWIFYAIVTTLSIGLIGAGMNELTGGDVDTKEVTLYLLVGSIVWGYLAIVFWEISHTISLERWEGTLEYTFMAPISRVSHLLGTSIFALTYGIFRTSIVFVIAVLFFEISFEGMNIAGAALILAVSSMAFVGLGMIAAIFPLLSAEKGSQFNHIIEASIMMVSGIFYPVSVLPGWMQVLSKFSPATYTIEGMRMAILEGYTIPQLIPYIQPLIILGIICIPGGILIFSQVEKHVKKVGTLKRSG